MPGIVMLTPKDIQQIFHIGKNQSYELMRSDGFPTITLNKRMYVEESSLRDWLSTQKGKQFLFN